MSEDSSIAARSITCRRCGQPYLSVPQGRGLLLCCPHCGASPTPLRKHLRHNGLAAVLAVVAMIVLVVGMVVPLISMSKLGQVRSFSLIGGIVELFHKGNLFIAAILLTFSVIFPIVKLVMILVATSRLVSMPQQWRRRMHTIAVVSGKYSLLDLVVVAVMIVLVKFGEFADVRARGGTVLFGLGVLLSIAAGLCVNFDEAATEDGR
ncbi:paraquat-inducible protein A [Fontivita pretiosa]|uniref:paraquat-inducible protein A n=1 Tax=Fontivita pretiosa TaxID=2989684 RepID=UPI003D1799CF